MDFQRLFKRKEECHAPPIARDDTRQSLNEREVLLSEGELLDGTNPASLLWSKVGGVIRVKASKILGILEGRTRIQAAVLQEVYPCLFEKAPNPGTEFNIPLQTVVMQLEDLFSSLSSEEAALEDFNTPFGQLAREDEAITINKHADRPAVQPTVAPELFMRPQPGSKLLVNGQDQIAGVEMPTGRSSTPELEEVNPLSGGNSGSDECRRESESHSDRSTQPDPSSGEMVSASGSPSALPGGSAISSGAQKIQSDKIRREGHERLQELYLTDESLGGSRVADMILQLPRVAGVVIMLSDGAVLGGGFGGGLSEELLSLTPDFAKQALVFVKSIQEDPVKVVTFSGHAWQISLTICREVLILAEHLGKNLPPGLRERLVATAQALNMIYGLQP